MSDRSERSGLRTCGRSLPGPSRLLSWGRRGSLAGSCQGLPRIRAGCVGCACFCGKTWKAGSTGARAGLASPQLVSCSCCDKVPHTRGLNCAGLFSELQGPGEPPPGPASGRCLLCVTGDAPPLTPASASVVTASPLTPDPQDPGRYLGPPGIQLASRCRVSGSLPDPHPPSAFVG